MTHVSKPFPKVISKCAQTCHCHPLMQEDVCHKRVLPKAQVEHIKSTTRPFDGVNNSIRSCKKPGNFLYGPSKVFLISEEECFFFMPVPKNVDFGCLVDFLVIKSLTKT
jgi:hypothetical protein